MKQHLYAGLTLVTLGSMSLSAYAADAPKPGQVPPVPQGCVKLEDEIKFSGKDGYYDADLGHFTAGKLEISLLNQADSTAVGTIRADGMKDLKEDNAFLTKGEITLESKPLTGDPAPTSFVNSPFSPKANISIKIQKVNDDGDVNIAGSIKLKDFLVQAIKRNYTNQQNPATPISVCGIGLNLSIDKNSKIIRSGSGSSVILYINNGSDSSIVIQAQNTNRDRKAISIPIDSEMATVQDGVGAGSAM